MKLIYIAALVYIGYKLLNTAKASIETNTVKVESARRKLGMLD